MKTLRQYLTENEEVVLYDKAISNGKYVLNIPAELQNAKFKLFYFGRPSKKVYTDLDEAIDSVMKTNCVSFEDVDKITYYDSIVDVKYTFGNDTLGFSLKKI